MSDIIENLSAEIADLAPIAHYGKVTGIMGMLVEIGGIESHVSIGDRCNLKARNGKMVPCEIIGFKNDHALAMPFDMLEGVGLGCEAIVDTTKPAIYPTSEWLGRVINALGEPVDGKGPLPRGKVAYPLRAAAPSAHQRQRVVGKVDVGVKTINTFLTMCRGQRMGIFSGSGVGKSTLMSMMARFTECDVSIIGLVGERGREVQEFIQDDLGDEGLARSIVVVATSDQSPLLRRQAAYMTMALAEFFRDQQKNVLCMIDSITRFAMAQREIGLSAGEPPATKGYTPTVFVELPKLLERAGPGIKGSGYITGIFNVLVEGDDHNEPISDAVRGIIDGHIVMERAIAERGRYPAINVLKSISRTMPDCNNDSENELVSRARILMAAYDDMAEMIRLGAYRKGSDPRTDEAIFYNPMLEDFLKQKEGEPFTFDQCYQQLATILEQAPE